MNTIELMEASIDRFKMNYPEGDAKDYFLDLMEYQLGCYKGSVENTETIKTPVDDFIDWKYKNKL